ncbi:MAG: hypothetical protein ABSB35_01895 [Bryobacteraceae bacterium]|jgi:hypothetical protein
MDAKTYLKISTINLVFLLIGLSIGVGLMSSGLVSVHAQTQTKENTPTRDGAATKVERASSTCDEAHFECVTPTMTVGVAGFNQVLAHQVATDQVIVSGIDLLRLHENTLNLIRSKNPLISLQDIQRVVDDSRVAKPLRLRPQQ